jgi:DNA gyrase/topoisomerase IV subunit A
MALEENKCSTEIDLEILEKLQNIEYNVSMNSKDIESIKNELSHIKNGFKDDLIARLLDTLEIQRKDKKEIRTKIIDWIIKLTMSGGLIYMVISSFFD